MPEVIKLRKGLDIKLKGTAEKELVSVKASKQYALVPDDFIGVTPKAVSYTHLTLPTMAVV